MRGPAPPPVARLLLRLSVKGRYLESLEGDLLEELAAGRTAPWYWFQVLCAIRERAQRAARQQLANFGVAMLFFLTALWNIAPLTHRVMQWSAGLLAGGPWRWLVLLGWLAAVPLVLGGTAGALERRRCAGAILLAAGIAYLTPVTLPLSSAVCELCSAPAPAALPGAVLILLPLVSASLAGLGARFTWKLFPGVLTP